jgi:glycosyltransferase involved in cell wall biosynthesis
MTLVHLTSSTFFGGPERQMLGLAEAMPESVRTAFISFREGGRNAAFLNEVASRGFEAIGLQSDFPQVRSTLRELTGALQAIGSDVLLCHGYKANILGRIAARRIGIPAIAVSRGWTGENRKVRLYEWLDRRQLRFMDHVVCVSEGQAEKVRRWCGVDRPTVIRNSARLAAFQHRDPAARDRLLSLFNTGVSRVVIAAGRLSPEKGFQVLLDAAPTILAHRDTGLAIFGEGTLRPELERRVNELGLADRIVLPGFRSDLDSLLTAADVMVLPSFTEGLPNVVLEASAAVVPVVATAVGGTPEVVADGETGYLVPPGDPAALAERINRLLADEPLRRRFGEAGRRRMRELFTFDAQADAYLKLLEQLRGQDARATRRLEAGATQG